MIRRPTVDIPTDLIILLEKRLSEKNKKFEDFNNYYWDALLWLAAKDGIYICSKEMSTHHYYRIWNSYQNGNRVGKFVNNGASATNVWHYIL